MDISKRIVITFVTVALIPILVMSGLAAYTIYNVSSENASDAGDALEAEEKANLERLANDTALFIEESMQSYIDGVYIMEKYCEDLFNGRINASPQESYYWDYLLELSVNGRNIPGRHYDPAYEYVLDNGTIMSPGYVSFDVSCYYMPRPFFPNPADPFDLDPVTEYYLNVSSNMDNIFRALHQMNGDYIWLYIGIDPGVCGAHLFKNYPHDTLQYFMLDEAGNPIPPEQDYDPPEEEWYDNAAAVSIANSSMAFTGPYGDPSTGLVISMGRPVYYDNGTLIGVVSADVTLDTVLASVLDIRVLESGYAYLLRSDGGVIAHPDFALEGQTIYDLEFAADSLSEKEAFAIILDTVLDTGYGQNTFTKNATQWLVTFKQVPNSGFLLAVVVPKSEVIAPAQDVLSLVLTQTTYLTLVLGGVLAVVAVMVGVVSYKRGRSVTEPIKEMTRLVEKMAKQDFTRSITTTGSMYEEIGTTVDALLSFQEACRFGNQAFIRGDLSRALANYQNLLEISKRLHIEVGEQTMYLNIGNVFRQRADINSAQEYYDRALSIANTLLERAKADGTDEADAMDRIASVYHNMALLETDRGEYDKAMSRLEDAEAVDKTLDNKRGLARRYDAMGLVMMKQGRYSQARSRFDDARKLASAEGYDRALAYIGFHMGEFHVSQSDLNKAKASFLQAIELAERTEEFWLQVYSMQQLADVYDQLDEPSHDIRRNAEKLRRSIQFKKSVVFVIDYSGSMRTQDRIKAAVEGARAIFESQINPQDEVSIITFNIALQQVLPLTKKGEYRDLKESPVHRALDSIRYPNYSTAFYDALGKALEDLNKIESSEHRWIIALSDGQDNSSKTYSLDALKGIVTEKDRQSKKRPLTIEGFIRDNHLDVNLIIIGVGEELKKEIDKDVRSRVSGKRMDFEELLRSVCESIPQGQYLSVVDSHDVQLDIEKAFKQIGVLMAQLEVGGATDDY
ncbi:MAG: hypothetical protein C4K49_06360 [Candidatus Thorarchaeota archaeon]|nr:MAG: hypothetical protein C4K49_06360 [Candidatus Thorarchaeota archaeon]